MKIGVISDTHLSTRWQLPEKLKQILAQADLILHAGDLVSLEVLEGLKKLGPEVKAVWGNMDPPEVRRALPEKQVIQFGGLRIGLAHGIGAPVNLIKTVQEQFKDDGLDCIVFGHSHSPCNEVRLGVLYFNPGSPTDKFFAPYNSFGILEIGQTINGRIIKL
ncbi:MAG: metallophosphoesterase family protein [Candidatus Omnitrophica bacterium]|nr:metallophosphoesterase family protein [Candidatus Omnitrophota bacterium]